MKKTDRSQNGEQGVTVANLVILSLLLEQPGTGYDLHKEFERQAVKDWAQVSKAQVYYILRQLAANGFVHGVAPEGPLRRIVYSVTVKGKSLLREQLTEPKWLNDLSPSNFTTWLGLAVHSPDSAFRANLERRRNFLKEQLSAKQAIEPYVRDYPSARAPFGLQIIALYLAQIQAELSWVEETLASTD